MAPAEGGQEEGGELGHTLTLEYLRLREVYRDRVHANPDTHLDGGISENTVWQPWWRELTVMPLRRYETLSGNVGRHFTGTLGGELRGVLYREWNSERFIVYQMVILQRARHVAASHAIRYFIEKRLEAWEDSKHRMLVKDTLCTCVEYLTVNQR